MSQRLAPLRTLRFELVTVEELSDRSRDVQLEQRADVLPQIELGMPEEGRYEDRNGPVGAAQDGVENPSRCRKPRGSAEREDRRERGLAKATHPSLPPVSALSGDIDVPRSEHFTRAFLARTIPRQKLHEAA